MYYVHVNQPYTNSNHWQNTSQVHNWREHERCNRAEHTARGWVRGWDVVDSHYRGGQYWVHLTDGHRHYKTVIMDNDFGYEGMEDGYR